MSGIVPLSNYNVIEATEQLILNPLDPLDDPWSLYQEILQSTAAADQIINESEVGNYNLISSEDIWNSSAGAPIDRQPHEIAPGIALEIGLESMKIVGSPKLKTGKKINRKLSINDHENGAAEEAGSSVAKKLDHNAKERIRRMKLNASYLALRALLPDSRKSKKRWCAPAIVDRVLIYIPELENEVQALRSKKEILESEACKNNKLASNEEIPRFSFNKLNQEEAIIQISMGREDYGDGLAFTSLMQSVEDEGILIHGMSAVYICDSIICCHLHIQTNDIDAAFGVDYIEQLRDKMISWL